MKKVETLISNEEYLAKVQEPLKQEVLKAIESSQEQLPKSSQTVAKSWFLALAWTFLILGFGLFALGAYLIMQGDSIPAIISGSFGLAFIIAGIVMFTWKTNVYKKINSLYESYMDKEKLFQIAVEGMPGLELKSIDDVRSNQLSKLRYKIPSDARVIEASPLFKVTYKEKYNLEFQSAKYHWKRRVKTNNGYRTTNHYGNSGFASISTDSKFDDLNFSMNTTSFLTKNTKIDLENKEFVKTFKFRANDEVKSRMLFTPLAMEEILKFDEKNPTTFKMKKERNIASFWFPTIESQFIIDAKKGKTMEITANNYVKDITSDFYSLYKKIGVIFVPPFL